MDLVVRGLRFTTFWIRSFPKKKEKGEDLQGDSRTSLPKKLPILWTEDPDSITKIVLSEWSEGRSKVEVIDRDRWFWVPSI